MQHRGARDGSRRQHPQAEPIADERDLEREGLQAVFRQAKPAPQQCAGDFRAQDRLMAGEMIGMGMRNKGARLRIPWVQPQVGLRQVKAALKSDFDHTGGLTGFCGSARANRVGGHVRSP